MAKVVIFQHRLLHYRQRLFDLLKGHLDLVGVELVLIHGKATHSESTRKDEGELSWATEIKNRSWRIAGKDLLWQGYPAQARHADLVVLLQENRIVSNYLWQMVSVSGGFLIGFWGHGKNYQAISASGLREKWKAWWLKRVDWWFAYTSGSAQYLQASGFAQDKITVLDNAIDVSGFLADLDSVTANEMTAARQQLGITPTSQVAIYCGSIYAEKRIAVLLQAADLLHARLPDFHLLVVGDGPEGGLVKAAAATRPWLHVRGIRKGREKALEYRLASVVLNPGAVGLHIVDAFAARVPLVTQTTALHGPEYDYLVNGVNGLSVDDDSAESYAQAVARIYTEPALMTAMQAQCAADAQRYTVERMAQNFADGIVACLVRHGRLAAVPAAREQGA